MKKLFPALILSAGIASCLNHGTQLEAKGIHLTKSEVNLIAQVTMAEAEAEPTKGQRLVIDTILNRVKSKTFPNTVNGVIYQPNQYSVMWCDRFERCYPRKDLKKLVRQEARKRTDNRVIFFTAGAYSQYGTPLYVVGHHYFSSL